MPCTHEMRFDPPGPGSWEVESVHVPRPVTKFAAEFVPEQLAAGFKETTARYGMLLDHIEQEVVNGFLYTCARPVGAPRKAAGPPPPFVMKLMFRIHPELRRRVRTASKLFETKPWIEDMRVWDEEVKPRSIRECKALLAVDPDKLSGEALLSYINDCRENSKRGTYRHHRFNGAAMVPLGDFLAHARQWTGLPAQDLMALMVGATPLSAGDCEELTTLVAALRSDQAAMDILLAEAEAPQILARLGSLEGPTGDAFRAYIDLAGHRLASGYDVGDLRAVEMPATLVDWIRASVAASQKRETEPFEEALARIADKVPAEHRDQFNELLADARLTYRLRDERGLYADVWAHGITRRAILAAGKQLEAAGRVEQADHLVEAGWAEIQAIVRGNGGPPAEELKRRYNYRMTHTYRDAPAHLGGQPSPPPPLELLPAGARRAAMALGAVMEGMFAPSGARPEQAKVRGKMASPGLYEGTARILEGPADFGRIQDGDVLVTTGTSPAFAVVLPKVGAIVTERGGILSHAAIVAREYGVPGVVGCDGATTVIPDGARVRVDANSGEVSVL